MKEIVIKIDENIYNDIKYHNGMAYAVEEHLYDVEWAIRNGKVLPKGHTELIDTKKLIQSVARSADNMKNNGVAPIFDAHEITNLILAQDVLIEADKEEE